MAYSSRNSARRLAFERVPETCPMVNKAFKQVQLQISNLREALIKALEESIEKDDRINELESLVSELKDKLSLLEK